MAKAALVLGALVLGLAVWWAFAVGPLRDPEAAFADFLDPTNRAEDQLTDPLVLSGRRVAPRVTVAIRDPAMPLRRYAIGFLGCRRHEPALPAFLQIVGSPAEEDFFRADALEAIWLTASAEGKALARHYEDDRTHLGEVARDIVAGRHQPYCRTWWQAFADRHD